MIRNNGVGFLCYLTISIIIYSLSFYIDELSYNSKNDYFNLILQPLIFLLAICMFVITGRYLLRDQGSKMKNVFSICLTTILGIGISVQDLIFQFNTSSTNIDPYLIYLAYSAPIVPFIDKIGLTWNGWVGFIMYCILSCIPCVLMWLGIQWRINKI